jgi:hypothetical protein
MFAVGDKVTYAPKNHKAVVIRIFPKTNEYLIAFDDSNLIPPQMIVPSASLTKEIDTASLFGWMGDTDYYDDEYDQYDRKKNYQYKDKEIRCPRCGEEWKETIIGRNTFYDCLKCNLKKEDA